MMPGEQISFGERLRTARESRNWSRAYLASKIPHKVVSEHTIKALEMNSERSPLNFTKAALLEIFPELDGISEPKSKTKVNEFECWLEKNGMEFVEDKKTGKEHVAIKIPEDIYFIRAGNSDFVKIGFATHGRINERLRALQTANPEELKLLGIISGGGINKERELHKKFRMDRIRGEWFRLTAEILDFIKTSTEIP